MTSTHQKRDQVTMMELRNGDVVSGAAGIFHISNRHISFGHRSHLQPGVDPNAPENENDVVVFDGVALDPGQKIQSWTIQGNRLRHVERIR